MKDLPCYCCGNCCRPGALPLLMLGLPSNEKNRNQCARLGEDNRCTIYATRPEICRGDELFNRLNKQTGLPWDLYLKMHTQACEISRGKNATKKGK